MITGIAPGLQMGTLINGQSTDDQRLKDACTEFEALFISQLMREMRKSIPDNGLIKRSDGEKLFQEMLDGEYARIMSKSNARGLGAQLYQQMQSAVATPEQARGTQISAKK